MEDSSLRHCSPPAAAGVIARHQPPGTDSLRPASLRCRTIAILGSLLLIGATLPLPALSYDPPNVDIQWRVPQDQSIRIQKSLRFDGSVRPDTSTVKDTKSPALIYVLTGVVSLDILVRTLMNAYKELRYGGLVVRRGKTGKLEIENDSRLSGGMIVVDKGSGSEPAIFQIKDQPQSSEILQAITPLLGR